MLLHKGSRHWVKGAGLRRELFDNLPKFYLRDGCQSCKGGLCEPKISLDGLVPGADSVKKLTLILAILSVKNSQKLEAITAGDWNDGRMGVVFLSIR